MIKTEMRFGAIMLMAGRTPVPKTPMEFVHGTRGSMIPIDGILGVFGDAVFPLVASMTNRNTLFFSFPMKPFESQTGLLRILTPTTYGFIGNGLGLHAILAKISVAGRGDGHVRKGIKIRMRYEDFFEFKTPLF